MRIARLWFLGLEFLDACLDRAYIGFTKCIDELDPRQARDFGSLALRDQPPVVPAANSKGTANSKGSGESKGSGVISSRQIGSRPL